MNAAPTQRTEEMLMYTTKFPSVLSLAALCVASSLATAAQDPAAGMFGAIDRNSFPTVEVSNPRPVKGQHIHAQAWTPQTALRGWESPIFLHVRQGEELRWSMRCKDYDACNVPVFFVSESWFRNVYLPTVGGQDGSEQRYRDLVRVERVEREARRRCPD
jgi:hypothetical protein